MGSSVLVALSLATPTSDGRSSMEYSVSAFDGRREDGAEEEKLKCCDKKGQDETLHKETLHGLMAQVL